jgi:hypothetical protein
MRIRIRGCGRARVIGRTFAGVAAVAVLLVSCTTRSRPMTFEQEASRVQGSAPDTRPWFCNAVGKGTPPSGHGNGHEVHPYYEGKTKGPLSWADCKQLADQLDQTLGAVKGIETKAKGEAAGWRQAAPYVPGLGTHHQKSEASTPPSIRPNHRS